MPALVSRRTVQLVVLVRVCVSISFLFNYPLKHLLLARPSRNGKKRRTTSSHGDWGGIERKSNRHAQQPGVDGWIPLSSPVQPASVSSSLGDTRGPATRACKNHGNLLCFLFFYDFECFSFPSSLYDGSSSRLATLSSRFSCDESVCFLWDPWSAVCPGDVSCALQYWLALSDERHAGRWPGVDGILIHLLTSGSLFRVPTRRVLSRMFRHTRRVSLSLFYAHTSNLWDGRAENSSPALLLLLPKISFSYCYYRTLFAPIWNRFLLTQQPARKRWRARKKKRKQVLLLYIWRNHAAARPPTFLHERVSVCFGRQRRRLLLLERKCTWMMIFSLSSVDGAGQLYGNQLTGVRNDVGGWGDISSDRPLKRKEKESSSSRHMAASSWGGGWRFGSFSAGESRLAPTPLPFYSSVCVSR